MGLAIITILAAALVLALNRRQHAGDRLSDTRGAAWAAEQAMAQMQAGGKPATGDWSAITVEAMPGDESAPRGYVWVRVRADRNGRTSMLTGLVPSDSVPPATSPARAPAEGGRP